jgi:peptide/nickel transport system permease protein
MTGYVLRRLLEAIPSLAVVSLLVFALLQASPGNPLAQLERDPTVSQDDIRRIAEQRGLLDPFPVQYLRWARGALRGDFGTSLQTGRPVTTEILDRLPNTVALVLTAFAVTLLIAIPIGVASAVRQYSPFDHLVTALAFMGQSIPIFW